MAPYVASTITSENNVGLFSVKPKKGEGAGVVGGGGVGWVAVGTDFFLFYIHWFGELRKNEPPPPPPTANAASEGKGRHARPLGATAPFPARCVFSLRGWGICQKTRPRSFSAVQNLNESLPELHVEGGVNDGVHGAVHVAQPSDGIIHLGGDLTSRAVGVQDMGNEKRQPAYDEYTWGEGRERERIKGLQEKGGAKAAEPRYFC